MKRLIFFAIVAAYLTQLPIHAQKIYKTDGRYFLDLTLESGMPPHAVTNVSKTALFDSAPDLLKMPNKLINESINLTVYEKLEISNDQQLSPFTWLDAATFCRNHSENGATDWRLPTQKELMLIYIFRDKLVSLGLKEFVRATSVNPVGNYMTCTQIMKSSNNHFAMRMNNPQDADSGFFLDPYAQGGATQGHFRCVREAK